MLSADHLNIDGLPFPVKCVRKLRPTFGAEVIYIRAFGAPRGSAPMARYYDSQLRSSLLSLLNRRAFGTPKDNGLDASIDIFLVASLEYHLI